MKSLSIPVDHSHDKTRNEHFLTIGNPAGLVVYSCLGYGSESSIRKTAGSEIVSILGHHRDTDRRGTGGRLLVCADGTVMVVAWAHAIGWQHTITGPDRQHASYSSGGMDTMADAIESARLHATGSYGGIVGDYPL